MKYLYLAIFHQNSKKQYEVKFPDLAPNAATFGENLQDALHMAKDALEGYLLTTEDYKEPIPKPSVPEEISVSKDDLLIPIEANTTLARDKEENLNIRKSVTIPKYLNDLGNEQGIDFSELLKTALQKKLDE
ncbi:type II toxin-antitoxin system HicB family antitoxin [Lentilactobacillus kosonis]|uniref:Phage-related protein n=1 Tax=Lentilactobacillus kosonis TaxID=2810561 RepID=A0A401FL05_9LACO|nr:type II toxin-antitoxin system HicB family antitoxin [Lentilactobacillus kosonis]GAY72891.1 phage-related protein [Lentilactobacillus kosonis]